MTTIGELREQLQAPRRPHDTWYGRNCMRPFSIYLTMFFSRAGASPALVTFLSVLFGLWGAQRLLSGHWLSGVLLVNLWYLLDHVDGELARWKNASSASGLYFDTIANAIVPPLALAAAGAGVTAVTGRPLGFLAGVWAGYTALMLSAVPWCEGTVRLQCGRAAAPPASGTGRRAASVFGLVHTAVSFPSVLAVVTPAVALLNLGDRAAIPPVMALALVAYGVAGTLVWAAIVARTVSSRRLDPEP